MVLRTPSNIKTSTTQPSGSESLQTPAVVTSVQGGPNQLIHEHLVSNTILEKILIPHLTY